MLHTHNGEAVLTRLADGRVRVDRADAHIGISNEFLEAEHTLSVVIAGDLVSFGDVNRVTYRITERFETYVQADRVDS